MGGREGIGQRRLLGKEPDHSVPLEMRKGGGFSGRIKRPTFTHEEKTSGQIVLDFDPFLNNVSTPELERYLLAGGAATLSQPKFEKAPRPRPAQYSEAGMQVCTRTPSPCTRHAKCLEDEEGERGQKVPQA